VEVVATTETLAFNTSILITAVKSFIMHACDKIQRVDQILKRMNAPYNDWLGKTT
jgi:hypothetical protein